MKRRYIVISSFFIACLMLGLLCYGSMKLSEKRQQEKSAKQPVQETVQKKENKTTSDTKYYLEIYEETTEELVKIEQSIPVEYVGLTREELEHTLVEYIAVMPEEEQDKGLVDMNLVSFDPEQIVIRKVYGEVTQEIGFTLKNQNGEVAIYNRSGDELYELTGILVANLSIDDQNKLEKGYVVESEKDLYSILENFSS